MSDENEPDNDNTTNDDVANASTVVPLSQDDDSPAAPPDDAATLLPPDHPLTDTGLDAHEIYDEGIDGATNVDATDETSHIGPSGTRTLL